jgi:hypothetical protein
MKILVGCEESQTARIILHIDNNINKRAKLARPVRVDALVIITLIL